MQPQPWSRRRKLSPSPNEEEIRAAGPSNPSPAAPFKASMQHFVAVVARNLLDGDGAESALSLASYGHTEETDPALQSRGLDAHALYPLDRSALPPKARLQSLLDSFLDGPNKMISICGPSESQNQLDNLYGQSENISDASLCLILLQLAVGARNLGVIPHQVCSTFYEGGRRAMDSGIENIPSNWLWVVQAHVLDCIYSMNAKPSMCWLVLGKQPCVVGASNRLTIGLSRIRDSHRTDLPHRRFQSKESLISSR